MKFKIEKVLKPLELKEYAPEFGETTIMVWINPPRILREKLISLQIDFRKETLNRAPKEIEIDQEIKKTKNPAIRMNLEQEKQELLQSYRSFVEDWNNKVNEWFVEIWSQGTAETKWTVEELNDINQADPKLLAWLLNRTREMIDVKKD